MDHVSDSDDDVGWIPLGIIWPSCNTVPSLVVRNQLWIIAQGSSIREDIQDFISDSVCVILLSKSIVVDHW